MRGLICVLLLAASIRGLFGATPAITITSQPAGQTVYAGESATFSVLAEGELPLTYSWARNGKAIGSAAADTLTLENVTKAQAGNYTVTIKNSTGKVTSEKALLTVLTLPAITKQPRGQTNKVGSKIVFSVTATGDAPLSYQWQKDGLDLSEATGASLTLGAITVDDAGTYSVTVTNRVGSASSVGAELVVTVPPTITTQPEGQVIPLGQAVAFRVEATGTQPIKIQWQKGTTAIAKATNETFALSAVKATDDGNYRALVQNVAGSRTSLVAVLTVGLPPTVKTQPRSQTNAAGTSVTLLPKITGSEPFAYIWQKNGSELSAETNLSLTLADLSLGSEGLYRLVANNSYGSVTTTVAKIGVRIPLLISGQPIAQAVQAGQGASFSVEASGNEPLSYQWRKEGKAIKGATNNYLELANLVVAIGGNYSVLVRSAYGASLLSSNAPLTVLVAPSIVTHPRSVVIAAGRDFTFSVKATGNPLAYQWVKDGADLAGATNSTLALTGVQAADEAVYSVWVSNPLGSLQSSNATLALKVPLVPTEIFTFSTWAGAARKAGSANGSRTVARFRSPTGMAIDGAGNLYIADTENSTIRKISAAGVVSTLAGTAGQIGASNGLGALFFGPKGIAIDSSGNVAVADTQNSAIRLISPEGLVSTLAGSTSANPGNADGTGSSARFFHPAGLAADGAGNLYVADTANHSIRKVTAQGEVTTVAGSADGLPGSDDGAGSAARFNSPMGLALDSEGNLLVADMNNATIRRIDPSGDVTTLAGVAGSRGALDGTGAAARFSSPAGIAVVSGTVYIADTGNHTVRRISAAGVVSTIGGLAETSGSTEGKGNLARFNSPSGITFDSAGTLYVVDSLNHTIRKGVKSVVLAGLEVAPSSSDAPVARRSIGLNLHSAPTISASVLGPAPGGMQFSIPTRIGLRYRLEFRETLDGDWNEITTVEGDGGEKILSDPGTQGRTGFYRIGVE